MAKSPPPKTSEQPPHYYFDAVLPWQQAYWHNIVSRFPHIPHALLLSGPEGSGKRQFADQLAAWLMCLQRPVEGACGVCSSCLWLKADTHPNLLRVSREVDAKAKQSQFIKIEQVRELMPFVQQTGEGWRVIILEPAEALNIAAANALLKTLEEPSDRVALILVSDQHLQLPATIRSRLQQYTVGVVQHPQAVDYLHSHQIDTTTAHLLLGLSGGAPLKALALKDNAVFLARAAWMADWQRLVQQKILPIQCSSVWQKKLTLFEFLQLLQWMLRDVIAQHMGQAPIQIDLNFDLLCQQSNVAYLFNLQQDILRTYQFQSQNIQAGLVYDRLMMRLMNLQSDT